MTRMKRAACWGLALSSVLATTLTAAAQVGPNLYAGLQWRNVGPFHGGRISSVTGVIGEPGTFYFGAPQGGIWKTTSAGVTWFPIFDEETSVDSVGAIQVAPSNPEVVYAGAGDPIGGSLGNGMWKSIDAGKTWQHIGLEDTVKITNILVDPADSNLVIVSALGDATHHGGGVYRSTDGGKSWTSIVNGLPRDERTGSWVNSLRVDPEQPGLLFAGTETTVYVSFDNGDHWQSLRQNLPTTSIRDLDLHADHHQNDLIIGTYGRGFWVLDDITPLRQIAANASTVSSASAYLFKPEDAIRARINSNWDQPSPSKCLMFQMLLMARSWIITSATNLGDRSSYRSSTLTARSSAR